MELQSYIKMAMWIYSLMFENTYQLPKIVLVHMTLCEFVHFALGNFHISKMLLIMLHVLLVDINVSVNIVTLNILETYFWKLYLKWEWVKKKRCWQPYIIPTFPISSSSGCLLNKRSPLLTIWPISPPPPHTRRQIKTRRFWAGRSGVWLFLSFPFATITIKCNKLADHQSTHVAFFPFLLEVNFVQFVCMVYSEAFIKSTILGLVVYSAVLVYF